jgi:hypothetical protein
MGRMKHKIVILNFLLFLLSSYPSPILLAYIKKHGWKTQWIVKSIAVTKLTNKKKTEMLIYNYDTNTVPMQHLSGTTPLPNTSQSATVQVRFIRRYVNFHQKEVSLTDLKSYVDELQVSITSKQVTRTSPHAEHLNIIQEKLVTLLNTTRSARVRIELKPAELNRYLKIITSAVKKQRSGLGEVDKERAELKISSTESIGNANEQNKNTGKTFPRIMTAAQLSKMDFKTLPFTGIWKGLFGEPAENFDLMIHGGPHMGKTTFLLKIAAYLANTFGKVMYISSEEYGSATLTKKVNTLIQPVPERLSFARNLEDVDFSHYGFFIIDSVNDLKLSLDAYKALREANPHACFILVLQHTKDGQFRGGKDWEHKVEIGAEIYEPGKIRVFRNRYSVYGNYDFMKGVTVKEEKVVK